MMNGPVLPTFAKVFPWTKYAWFYVGYVIHMAVLVNASKKNINPHHPPTIWYNNFFIDSILKQHKKIIQSKTKMQQIVCVTSISKLWTFFARRKQLWKIPPFAHNFPLFAHIFMSFVPMENWHCATIGSCCFPLVICHVLGTIKKMLSEINL